MHCEGELIVKLYSIDYNQLQVAHPDLRIIKEIAQINARCMSLLGFIKVCPPVKLFVYNRKLKPFYIKLFQKE